MSLMKLSAEQTIRENQLIEDINALNAIIIPLWNHLDGDPDNLVKCLVEWRSRLVNIRWERNRKRIVGILA